MKPTIKLIIWDLDNTFWQGILSEETVTSVRRNIALVRKAVDRGIMNSICSKNDPEQVKNRLTSTEFEEIWDDFVFPSINWMPKGPRLKQLLEDMALRAENVLFIDDDPSNRREAQFFVSGIQVAGPEILDEVYGQLQTEEASDIGHSRLKRYRTLERKTEKRKQASSNEEFLRDSDIRISLIRDCAPYATRIHELLSRANQLNFTKCRPSQEEIDSLIGNSAFECVLVKARDRYGDYGEIGFYAIEKQEPHHLKHFTFSCRSLGMGVEQYLYQKLGYPPLEVSGKTAVELRKTILVDWIREEIPGGGDEEPVQYVAPTRRILLKGPCDIDGIVPYLSGTYHVDIETNFVDSRNIIVAGSNNSTHLYETFHTPLTEIRGTIRRAPFLCEADFMTYMFQESYDAVVFSTLSEGHSGVYRDRKNGLLICFGSSCFDMTKPENRQGYLSGELPNHQVVFTMESLEQFAETFDFVGHLSAELVVRNLRWMREKLPMETRLILLLGSEVEACPNTAEFAGHAPIYRHLNDRIREAFLGRDNVTLINITDLITGQDGFDGCTNHFSRLVYRRMAEHIETALLTKAE